VKRGVFVRRYREPQDDEKRVMVRIFAEHGIELRFPDVPEGTQFLIFFGALLEEPEGEEET
jgi:hypothetical protein